MRDFLRAGLVVVCLILVLVQGVAAFNVSRFVVNPSDEWLPGTLVSVSGTIDFAPLPDEKFDARHDLRFNTTLENVQWDWASSVKGVVTPVPTFKKGIIAPVLDNAFHYPKNDNVILKFHLLGEAPAVKQTTNITILRIYEVDEKGILIPGSSREYGEVVVYSEGSVEKENKVRSSLQTFRDHIDEKTADGVNTTLAELKYLDAKQKITTNTTYPPYSYLGMLEKFRALSSAENDISDGERLLDKAWAENEVTDAQVPINNVDAVIRWFKGNSSTADDPQIPAIIAKRELAVSYLATANDEINSGNFEQGRVKAQEAFQKANESYNDALSRKYTLEDADVFCWGCGSWHMTKYVIPSAAIVAVILLILGIFRLKKST